MDPQRLQRPSILECGTVDGRGRPRSWQFSFCALAMKHAENPQECAGAACDILCDRQVQILRRGGGPVLLPCGCCALWSADELVQITADLADPGEVPGA